MHVLRSREPNSVTRKERKFALTPTGPHLSHYPSHVLQAARAPVELDDNQANAVAARIELDLRIGAAFTRLQTLQLQAVVSALRDKIISYGKSILHYCSRGRPFNRF